MRDAPAERLLERVAYPAINPAFVPVQIDENTVHLRAGPWSGPMKTVHDQDGDGEVATLFDALDGQTHVSELLASFPERDQRAVASLLLELAESNVVYDRRERGESAWPHLAISSDAERPDRIADRSVLLVGVGGAGSQVAADLLEAGVEDVRLARPRAPDAWDGPDREGVSRAGAIADAVPDVDFAAAIVDRPSRDLLRELNGLAIETNTPWISAQTLGCDGIVGPAVFPGETACYDCFEERLLSNAPNQAACERYLAAEPADGHDGYPSLERIVAGYLGRELLHLLGYGSGYTAGRVLTVDAHSLSFASNDVLRLPRCDSCGKARGDDVQRFLTMDEFATAAQRDAESQR